MITATTKSNNYPMKSEVGSYQSRVRVSASWYKIMLSTMIILFPVTALQSYAEDKTIDQKLNLELKRSVFSYFNHTLLQREKNPLSIIEFEGFKFEKLWRNIYLIKGGQNVIKGRPIPRVGSHIFIKFLDPTYPPLNKIYVEGIADGKGGLKDIVNIKVVDGARVVTNNGNRFKYKKGH